MNPQHAPVNSLARAARSFRRWRLARPFWGGLFTALAGLEIFGTTQLGTGAFRFQLGPTGFLSWLIPAILIACGLLMWFTPQHRMFYAIVGAVTAVFSLIGVNLGGFFIGLLLGLVGGGLGFAWTPAAPAESESAGTAGSESAGTAGSESAGTAGGTTPRPGADPPLLAITLLLLGVAATGVATVPVKPAQASPCPTPTGPSGPATRPQLPPAPSPPGAGATDIVGGILGPVEAGPQTPAVPTAAPAPTARPSTPGSSPSGGQPAPGLPNCPPEEEDSRKRIRPHPGQPLVAKLPSELTGSKAVMYGMRMDGVVDLPTVDGTIRTLKFSMDRAVTYDFRLRAPGPAGENLQFDSSALTVTGDVTFYATRFSGSYLGVRFTMTPDSPAPPRGFPFEMPISRWDDPQMSLVFIDCDRLIGPDLATAVG